MSFIVVGTNHKYSPIELRERIAFPKKRIKDALNFLKQSWVLNGAVILSTCNRVEIYASAEDTESGTRAIVEFILRFHKIDRQKLLPYLYIYQGKEALIHLFSVACGLDSLILGETQILGQVRQAYLESRAIGFADEPLAEIFNHAFLFSKMIHRKTGLSKGKVSVGSIAIDFIKRQLGSLSNKNILIIGVGKVTELVLKHLREEGPQVIFVSNRTFGKAQALAGRIRAVAVRFDRLGEFLKKADAVITATASPHFIIKKETLGGAIDHRLLIIDLALPRDVEPQVKEIENVELFCLEDLNGIIKKNVEKRTQQAEKVKEIIYEEAERICPGLIRLEPEPALLP